MNVVSLNDACQYYSYVTCSGKVGGNTPEDLVKIYIMYYN